MKWYADFIHHVKMRVQTLFVIRVSYHRSTAIGTKKMSVATQWAAVHAKMSFGFMEEIQH